MIQPEHLARMRKQASQEAGEKDFLSRMREEGKTLLARAHREAEIGNEQRGTRYLCRCHDCVERRGPEKPERSLTLAERLSQLEAKTRSLAKQIAEERNPIP